MANVLGCSYRDTIYLKTCPCTGKKEHHDLIVDFAYTGPSLWRRFYRCTKCRMETKYEEPAPPPPNVIDLDDV